MESTTPPSPASPPSRRLVRSRGDRVVSGVCGGIAAYFGIDALYIRIAAVASVFLAGLGLFLYLGALMLVPEEDGAALADTSTRRGRVLAGVGVVALVVAAGIALSGAVFGALWGLLPLAILALVGLFVWWLSSGQGLSGDWRVLLRRSLLGLAVLLGSLALFVAGGWAAGTGHGELAAALVIGAGVALLAGAFLRPVRPIILPALSLALGAAFVSAADVDLKGGVGERKYRPSDAADVRDHYRLGVGRLVVDLRDADLPRGDLPLRVKLGMGDAVLVVPRNVCVATRARVGAGAVEVFDHDSGGLDVDFEDLPGAPATTTRVLLDADVGLGALEVSHEDPDDHEFGPGRRFHEDGGTPGNTACTKAPHRASA
jgi:phage shock protein PspC (stress-responsive transcriptional regulator)